MSRSPRENPLVRRLRVYTKTRPWKSALVWGICVAALVGIPNALTGPPLTAVLLGIAMGTVAFVFTGFLASGTGRRKSNR
jgi:hypothetical protein